MFFLYNHETKGYRLYNLNIEKAVISRNITFNEYATVSECKKVFISEG
jgi:hypothetical protein